jgi:hypothetical protein
MRGGLLCIPKNICGKVFEPRAIAAKKIAALNVAADRSAAI